MKGQPKKVYDFQLLSRAASDAKVTSREVRTLTGQLEYVHKRKFPWWILFLVLALLLIAYAAFSFLPQILSSLSKPTPPPSLQPPVVSPSPRIGITITRPNGNEKFQVGSVQEIRWTTTNPELASAGSVNLEFSTDGGKTWSTIGDARGSQGILEWKIPDTASIICRIRATIRARSPSGDVMAQDTSDGEFAIFRGIQIIEPAPIPLTPIPKFEVIPFIPK